jgi:hypothetical protein
MKKLPDNLDAVCAVLNALSGAAMRSSSDATLRKFRDLCHHWEQQAAQRSQSEGQRRALVPRS